jgi:soluble lytic murein transglycosylase
MEALIASANHYLLLNQIASYEPLYRACYESFPGDPQAAGCHWKVTWGHYLRRNADAGDLLRAHLRLFPGAETAAGALYFLGRLAENAGDNGSARAYYEEITREYPNYYYTVQARARFPRVASAAVSTSTTAFLRGVKFPERVRTKNFEPNAAAKVRLERSRLLAQAGLEDWAEVELRFGAQTEDQSHVLAAELAVIETRRANPSQALRYIKRYASGYLYLPLETAPADFWRLAFPLPFRSDLERFSKQNGLDPFLMAALIRQESEFDAKVISRANARGLTQILPSTGKELSRKLKVAPYTTAALFQPKTNLQMGTFYLKSMIDYLGGNVEAALAAYNAGLSRANAWLSWGDFKEPAEFIETVPFTETRGYIQTVLRNADVYRRLYGSAAGPRAGLNE